MIKINLLPKSINEKMIVRRVAMLMGVLLLLVIGGGMGYSFKLAGDVQREEQLASDTEAYEARVKNIQAQTASIIGETAPIQAKLDFISNVLKYNEEYPKLYEQVCRWIYEKVTLVAMSSDGAQVTLQAKVKSIEDLGRFLLNMYQASDMFTEVSVTQANGFASGQNASSPSPVAPGQEIGGSQADLAGINAISGSLQQGPAPGAAMDVTVVCKLKTPIVAPTFGAAASTPGAPGAPAGPGPGEPQPNGPGL
jgi:hypothetical protein